MRLALIYKFSPIRIRRVGEIKLSVTEILELLRRDAQGETALEPAEFDRLFRDALADEFDEATRWSKVITGTKVRDYIVRKLEDPQTPDADVTRIAHYCFWARHDGIPGRAFGLMLRRLGPALERAKQSPGQEVEYRDWIVYECSDAEKLVDKLSTAIEEAAKTRRAEAEWRALIASLEGIAGVDFRKVRVGDAGTTGYAEKTIDLYGLLCASLGSKAAVKKELDQVIGESACA